jgi:hypothetical protein
MRAMPHRLVFIDETSTNTKLTRLRGRALRGERAIRRGSVRPLAVSNLHRRPALQCTDGAVGDRRCFGPAHFRSLHRNPACPDSAARRRCHARQSEGPRLRQGRRCSEGLRRLVPVPACLLAGSQSHRDGLLEVESPPACRGCTHLRRALARRWRHLLTLPTPPMLELPQPRRLCFPLKARRSRQAREPAPSVGAGRERANGAVEGFERKGHILRRVRERDVVFALTLEDAPLT